MTQEASTPPGFWDRIQKMIEDAVAKLARSGMLRNASISEGGTLTIKGGSIRALFPASLGGSLGAFWGDIKNVADGSYIGTGILVQDPDGQDIAQFRTDDATGTTLVLLNDAQGNNVLSTFNAAVGLNRPFLQGGFVPERFNDWTVNTTSATFETLWRGNLHKQNPGMFIRTKASMDTSGTTGEIRIMVGGVQWDTTRAVGFAVSTLDFGPADIAGAHMQFLGIEIQGRRTSATGALKVAPGVWMGRASS